MIIRKAKENDIESLRPERVVYLQDLDIAEGLRSGGIWKNDVSNISQGNNAYRNSYIVDGCR